MNGYFLPQVSLIVAAGLLALVNAPVSAQISLTFENPNYAQDFNHGFTTETTAVPLPWQDNVTLPGWYLNRLAVGSPDTIYTQATIGGTSAGEIYLASHTSIPTDFMLGARPTDGFSMTPSNPGAGYYYAVRLVNDSDIAMTSFSVAYDAFQWYRSTGSGANNLVVSYLVTPANSLLGITDAFGTWTAIDALNWTASLTSASSAVTANFHTTSSRVNFDPALVDSIVVLPGEELWVRWHLDNVPGVDQGVGIDNISIMTSIPEPTTLPILAAVFGLGFALYRRRQSA